jgi:hypothetical protein
MRTITIFGKKANVVLALFLYTASGQTYAQQKLASGASPRTTECLPENERLLTVAEHFRRLACGFTQGWDIVQTFGAPAATAGYSQLLTSHAGFSGNLNGFGEHYGVNLLGGVSSKFLGQFALPAAFHQDDRYKAAPPNTPVFGRVGHILKHIVLTQSADRSHRDVFNVAALPNSLLSAALSNTYQPAAQRTVAASAQRFGWNLFGFSAGDAFSEYGPQLKWIGQQILGGFGKIFQQHT